MAKTPEEWLKQADYDMATANYMFKGKRYFYAVFMCHLSIEKALKGLYAKKFKRESPKIHNLIYFLNKTGITPDGDIGKFLIKLNETQIITRYPEDLKMLKKNFTKKVTRDILINSKKALKWIKKQY